MPLSFTFQPRNYPSGDRRITVVARDHFGRSASQSWFVNAHCP